MIPVLVVGVTTDEAEGSHSVLLQELVGKKRLSVAVTPFEARAIQHGLDRTVPPRPQTHDLIHRLIESLAVKTNKVVIHETGSLRCRIALQTGSGILHIDAEPGDGIALALRTDASIFVEDGVLTAHGVTALSDGRPMSRKQIREELERQLERALSAEDYEDAARIRDSIQALDDGTP